jgi:hypothetical protein
VGNPLEFSQIELTVGGKYRHNRGTSGAYHDDLCLMMTHNILSRRSHPGGESFGVRQNLVVDLVPFQTVNECGRYVHNSSPISIGICVH